MTDKMNVMIDLETLGLKPGVVVLTLGAVAFDTETGVLNEFGEVHVRLNADHQHSVGLKTDPDTALWWMSKDKESQQKLLDMPAIGPPTVLAHFSGWLEDVTKTDMEDGEFLPVQVWGNGANFDAPLLRELYDAFGLRCPWAYWDECCYRTERKSLEALIRKLGGTPYKPPREGTHHDARDDAKYQVEILKALTQQRDGLIFNRSA